jgi:hypothetical protein
VPPPLLAALIAVVLVGLPAAPADARVDPAVPLDPFPAPPEDCIVPALFVPGEPCSPLRSPGDKRGLACTLPAVHLGGTVPGTTGASGEPDHPADAGGAQSLSPE